ncbi:MAG TPA: helix-turn-helix domain-containing protein, partial [Longimicrobiales bacterium]|nr:helix-turn-helix domain-containing protein [Longimicrobiales bacterium]
LLLADHFLERLATDGAPRRLTDEARAVLQAYDWPGNVRELENALERAAVLSKDGVIDVERLPARIVEPITEPLVSERSPANPTLEVIERAYVLWVLQSEGGNKARAAEVLGIDPSTLYRKLNRYGINES